MGGKVLRHCVRLRVECAPHSQEARPLQECNLPNLRGTVTMARWEDPNSGAGEFFINLGDSPHLDKTGDSGWALGFTVFGELHLALPKS